jgi:hypothetical protein
MNKLLKDAIADAKAVRETALANAKLALEEAFAPQMQRVFSEKIKMEMDKDPEDDNTKEGTYMEDEMKPENEMMNKEGDMAERMKELAGLNEYDPEFDDDDDDEETFDIGPEYQGDDDKDEFPDDDDEDTGYGDDEFEEGVDADLEEIIRQLEEEELAEADDEEEELPEPQEDPHPVLEEDLDEEINLDEVIAALREDDEDGDMEVPSDDQDPLMKEPVDAVSELAATAGAAVLSWKIIMGVIGGTITATGTVLAVKKWLEAKAKKGSKWAENILDTFEGMAGYGNREESVAATEELEEAYSVIEHLREKINEVNLLNAKLLYVNKLFKKHNLSEGDKVRVVETFDRAATVRETKIIYTTLSESFAIRATTKKTKVMEGFASTPVKKTQILTESNTIVNRFQKLAGLSNEE